MAVGSEAFDEEILLSQFGTTVHLYSTGPGGSGVTEQFKCTEPTVKGTGDGGELVATTL